MGGPSYLHLWLQMYYPTRGMSRDDINGQLCLKLELHNASMLQTTSVQANIAIHLFTERVLNQEPRTSHRQRRVQSVQK